MGGAVTCEINGSQGAQKAPKEKKAGSKGSKAKASKVRCGVEWLRSGEVRRRRCQVIFG